MVDRLSLDTSFLIDVQRERVQGDENGPALRLLAHSANAEVYVSNVALGEFAEGFPTAGHPLVTMVRQRHVLMPVDERTALIYADVTRELRYQGQLIGSNDLWIGVTALRHNLPLVTADVSHFRRIDGLEVVGYR